MDKITSSNTEKKIFYEDITNKAENKVLAVSDFLEVDKFEFVEHEKYKTIYFDTPDNLLTKSGVLLSKTFENGGHVLKVEKLNFLPNVMRLRQSKVFTHPIHAKDQPWHHSFYLIEGITQLFSTNFTIDLEHIIKKVKPIYTLEIESSVYRAFKSNGFKCLIKFDDVKYIDNKTKRKKNNKEVCVHYSGHENFLKDLDAFIGYLEKHCKDILRKDLSRFDYAKKITKVLPKQAKVKKKDLKSKADNKIEG